MPGRLRVFCLLAAWCCASGTFLELAQVAAWARMFAGYVPAMPVSEAVVRTLDPGRPCPICRALARAREARQSPPKAAVADAGKLVLFPGRPEPTILPATAPDWPDDRRPAGESWCAPVPVPPPRA